MAFLDSYSSVLWLRFQLTAQSSTKKKILPTTQNTRRVWFAFCIRVIQRRITFSLQSNCARVCLAAEQDHITRTGRFGVIGVFSPAETNSAKDENIPCSDSNRLNTTYAKAPLVS